MASTLTVTTDNIYLTEWVQSYETPCVHLSFKIPLHLMTAFHSLKRSYTHKSGSLVCWVAYQALLLSHVGSDQATIITLHIYTFDNLQIQNLKCLSNTQATGNLTIYYIMHVTLKNLLDEAFFNTCIHCIS